MPKAIHRLLFAGLLSAVIVGLSTPLLAQDKDKEKKNSDTTMPFNGKIVAVDKAAKTISLSGPAKRVLHITSTTKLTKAGKSATLENATVGDEIGGSLKKSADGKLEGLTVRLGAKPETGKGEEKKKK
jgi:hypothetical protein